MTTERKVRANFDLTKEYSVDVFNCTEEEKKEVQQAFFDVGIEWVLEGAEFRYLHASSYSNSKRNGIRYDYLMFGTEPRTDSISHQQFLELVYEPGQQGHIHAENMALYVGDAKTTSTPWELWQFKDSNGVWWNARRNPTWESDTEYRRKPKTHIVHGVEVPDLRFVPKDGDDYYLVDPTAPEFISKEFGGFRHRMRAERGLCYEFTEEGKQAATLHAKIMLGIA